MVLKRRSQKIIDGVLYKLCACGKCVEYFVAGKNSKGEEKRFVNYHQFKNGLSGELNHFYGKRHSDISKEKNRIAHIDKKQSEETIIKRKATNDKRYGGVWNKGIHGVYPAWNKGLTKETDQRVAKNVENSTKSLREMKDFFSNLGKEVWQREGHRENISNKLSGINHPFYRNNSFTPETFPRDYPLEWTKELKNSIRRRDNFKCRVCGELNGDREDQLHVHHIDYDKNNLDPDNLITLCVSCHGKTVANRTKWQNFFTKFVDSELQVVGV